MERSKDRKRITLKTTTGRGRTSADGGAKHGGPAPTHGGHEGASHRPHGAERGGRQGGGRDARGHGADDRRSGYSHDRPYAGKPGAGRPSGARQGSARHGEHYGRPFADRGARHDDRGRGSRPNDTRRDSRRDDARGGGSVLDGWKPNTGHGAPPHRQHGDRPGGPRKQFGDHFGGQRKQYGDRSGGPRKPYGARPGGYGARPPRRDDDRRDDARGGGSVLDGWKPNTGEGAPPRKSFGDRKSYGARPTGPRYGDRHDDRQGPRYGDRRDDRQGPRYGDRRDDRQGPRYGDRRDDRQGPRYGDRRDDRQGSRYGDRRGPRRDDDRRDDSRGGGSILDGWKPGDGSEAPPRKSSADRPDGPRRMGSNLAGWKPNAGHTPPAKRRDTERHDAERTATGDHGDRELRSNFAPEWRPRDTDHADRTGEERPFRPAGTSAQSADDAPAARSVWKKHEDAWKPRTPERDAGAGTRDTDPGEERRRRVLLHVKPRIGRAATRPESRVHTDIRSKGKGKPPRITSAVREESSEMRLNKYLALAGVAARRKADELIEAGIVRVNGKVITTLGVRIDPSKDEVSVNGSPVRIETRLVYILLNKPKDCITTTSDEKDRATVLDLVPEYPRVYPVGRLDRNTTGALLLTNDGDLAYRLMHPKHQVPRVYVAFLKAKIANADVARLREGMDIGDGEMTSPCQVDILNIPDNTTVGLVLREGRNHEVRRMFEAVGNEVLKLERVEYAGFTTAGLKRGGWRYLTEREIMQLKKSLMPDTQAKTGKRKK